jgi:putative NADH-flavin reductase
MAKKNNKTPKEGKSVKVSEKLGDFDIVIDSFGKIQSNYDVDKINEFLNKKLKNRNEDEDS